METIAERLRHARVLAKFASGSNAARAFGWPVSTYLGHENGDRTPNHETIQKYAKAFRVDPSYIAYGDVEARQISENQTMVPIKGIVLNAGQIVKGDMALSAGDLVKLDMQLPDDTFALIVMTEDMRSRFQIGDTLIVKGGFTSEAGMLDRHVYVKTSNAKEYICTVRRGSEPNRYDLLIHEEGIAIAKSVEIDEYGVIVLIVPGGFYGDLNVSPLITRISGPTAEAG